MKNSFFTVLFNPDAFFSDAMGEKEQITLPALIILTGGLAAAGYGYLIGGLSARMMAGAMPGIDTIIILSSVIGAFLGTFIFWLIWAGVFYLLSMAFKGEGTFRRTLELVGYGYLPQLAGTLITVIAAFVYTPRVTVPQLTAATLQDPVALQEIMKAFMHDPAMMELTQITTLVSIVFLLWSANIWIFAIQHSRKLSPRDAALCVGVPVVAFVFYLIYQLGVM
jgi:hypothetical protein